MTEENKTPSPEIEPYLKGRINAINATSMCFNLLEDAHLIHTKAIHVPKCLTFLTHLHDTLMKEAMDHPQADLIPELKGLKDAKAKAVSTTASDDPTTQTTDTRS